MEGLTSYLAMGGYGAFVWPAFGLTALILIWLLVATLHRLRARQRTLARLLEGQRSSEPAGEVPS